MRRMWGARKTTKAVDSWHTKAMLIDPRKTKLTIIRNTEPTRKTEKSLEILALNVKNSKPKQSTVLGLAGAQTVVQSKQDTRNRDQNLEHSKFILLEAFNTIFPPKIKG